MTIRTPVIRRFISRRGLTVVTENIPFFPSVSLGVWLKTGSRAEEKKLGGISHFIEHLVFKGTKKLTYSDIYRAFDRMGGVIDAFTSREVMGFYFRVQDSNFDEALSILADMLCHPSFPSGEIKRERSVILEEIKMVNDTPPERASDLFMESIFPDNPLGFPVQGDPESINKIKRDDIIKYHKRLFSPANVVVAATGSISHAELTRKVKSKFRDLPSEKQLRFPLPKYKPGIYNYPKKGLEQDQIYISFKGEQMNGKNLYPLIVLANLLGGTMSSLLFMEIRERLGLVYNITAENIGYRDAGAFAVQASCDPKNSEKTITEILKITAGLSKGFINEDALMIAKENILGGIRLSIESASSRLGRLARNELYFDRQIPYKTAISAIERVNLKDIISLSRKIFVRKQCAIGLFGNSRGLKPSILDPLNDV